MKGNIFGLVFALSCAVFVIAGISALPFDDVQAYTPSYTTTYTPSSSSGSSKSSTYTPSYTTTYTPSSSSGNSSTYTPSYTTVYTPSSSSNDNGGAHDGGCCESTYTPSYTTVYTPPSTYTPSYTTVYTPPSEGCTNDCGGGGGGCTSNCGGCTYDCGGCTNDCGGCSHNCNPPPKVPECTLSLNPSHVDYGDTTTISWTTKNAISAFLSGFGTVSTTGSRESGSITGTKTYTLTATASNGKTVTCSKTIKVEKEYDKDLECKLKVSDSRIERGDSTKLSWSSEGADYGRISPDVGDVDEDGSETVRPRSNTTYKGTFYNDDGDKVTCTVKVTVEDEYEPPVYHDPAPYVNLSAVPYTGLELGPVGTVIYWAFLVAWCLLAAYLIAVKRIHMSILRWYKKALFNEEVPVQATEAVSFAGFSQGDLAKLTAMLRGAVGAQPHTATEVVAVGDTTDPFIISQINRSKRS